MKLNIDDLVLRYRETRSNSDFNEIYRYLIERHEDYYGKVAKSLRADEHETRALYEDTLLECIELFNGDNFELYFNKALRYRRATLYKRRQRRRQHEILECELGFPEGHDFGDDSITPFEIAVNNASQTDNSAATEVLRKKTEADQRQLIDFLTQNMDAKTTAIVKAILEDDSPYKPTAIGKKLGLHHMQVKRSIEKLAGHFDRQKYGSHRDYLLAR